MNITNVLSQIYGMIFVTLGLSIIFNRKWTSTAVEEIVKNQGLIWFGGMIALTMGSIIVVLNNVWTFGLPMLVSVSGWLILIKGAFIMIFPQTTVSCYRKVNSGNILLWGGLIVFILGLVLLYR